MAIFFDLHTLSTQLTKISSKLRPSVVNKHPP